MLSDDIYAFRGLFFFQVFPNIKAQPPSYAAHRHIVGAAGPDSPPSVLGMRNVVRQGGRWREEGG